MVSTEYPAAKKTKLKGNSLANFIRSEVPKIIQNNAGNILDKYKVLVVKHAGNWSSVAWIVITNPKVSDTAKRGFYPVYSFFENGKKIMFSLGQGYYDIRKMYKKEANSILISRGIILKNKSGDFKKYGFKNVSSTKITLKKDKQREIWVKSTAFGKIYDRVVAKGGTSEVFEEPDLEDIEIIENLNGSEKKAIRKHREHEKYYIKTDPTFIKKLKKKFNYTCQACNLNFEKIYGKYNNKLDYVEAHHIVPKSEIIKMIDLNQELGREEKDFAILCANCHRMIHRYGYPSLEEFKKKIREDYKNFLMKE